MAVFTSFGAVFATERAMPTNGRGWNGPTCHHVLQLGSAGVRSHRDHTAASKRWTGGGVVLAPAVGSLVRFRGRFPLYHEDRAEEPVGDLVGRQAEHERRQGGV